MVSGPRKAAMLPREVLFAFFALVIFVTGCAGRKPVVASAPPPMTPVTTPPATADRAIHSTTTPEGGAYIEEGNASWYGAPFHGRRASNGEIYDMNKMTAAHRTMAFGTVVLVTDLTNGKTAGRRGTDHGPVVEKRPIHPSLATARESVPNV